MPSNSNEVGIGSMSIKRGPPRLALGINYRLPSSTPMSSWRVATFIAIAGIAVVFQLFFRDSAPHDFAATVDKHAPEDYLVTCKTIRKAISKDSNLFYPG